MANILNYGIFLQLLGDNKVIASINNINNSFEKVQKAVSRLNISAIISQVNQVAQGLNSLTAPGLNFEQASAELKALTGVSEQQSKIIQSNARAIAKSYGLEVSNSVESFKTVLSKLGPEIAKSPKALKIMGENIAILSKQMGGDTATSANVLTTAMNQFQVSTEDPIRASAEMSRMMNVMSAAAAEGSAEIPQINQALENAGMAAKAAGVSFEETNSAIQVLDAAGKKGAEGGIALRNVMATLSEGRFIPKEIQKELSNAKISVNALTDKNKTLSERLQVLKPLMNDSALMAKLFGKENSNAAMALIGQTNELDRLTTAITGTNDAQRQWEETQNTTQEKLNRMKATIDDWKVSLFEATGGISTYAAEIVSVGGDISNLLPLFDIMKSGILKVVASQKVQAIWNVIEMAGINALATATSFLSRTMWGIPIFWIIGAIAALVAIIAVCWNKFEGFRTVIFKGWEALKLFGTVIKDFVVNRFKELLSGITGIGQALLYFFQGKWSKAWEVGKKAVVDLSGVNSGANAVKNLKNGWSGAMGAGELQSKAYTATLKVKKTTTGIADPEGVPGAAIDGAASPVSPTADATNTNEAIATGGTKHNYITINLKELIGVFNNYAKDVKDGAEKASEEVADGLMRVLAMASTANG